jgi:hypothetical protein
VLNSDDITPVDREAIVALAKQQGIDPPSRIAAAYIGPAGPRLLMVTSSVITEGNHRMWRELKVCRSDWFPLPPQRALRSEHSQVVYARHLPGP